MLEETNGASKAHPIAWPNPIDKQQREALEQNVRELDRQARAFVREHPATVVIAAVTLGFLVGRLVRS